MAVDHFFSVPRIMTRVTRPSEACIKRGAFESDAVSKGGGPGARPGGGGADNLQPNSPAGVETARAAAARGRGQGLRCRGRDLVFSAFDLLDKHPFSLGSQSSESGSLWR